MESWQKSHIQKNLSHLQKDTKCNTSFLAVMIEHDIFDIDGNDISDLNAAKCKGEIVQSALLYTILLSRRGAFHALVDACEKTRQTGALDYLKQILITDSTTWAELSDECKKEMKSRLVIFQGKKLKLSECCKNLLHLIDGKFLKELENRNNPTIVNNQVPAQVKYYIPRTLRSKSKLDILVFQQDCKDVFVFEGMDQYELTSLVPGKDTSGSEKQADRLTVRFILLEYEENFESICEQADSPVHLIRYKDNAYEWIESSGSVENLQNYVVNAQLDGKDDFSEVDLVSKRQRVNLIPDLPGMGKTLLLTNIAHQIRKGKPNLLIRFIIMQKLVQDLSTKEFDLKSIISWIAEQSSEFKCGREIVEHILMLEPCILMFDGFDEVPLNQEATGKKILETIISLKSAQIFVTTRRNMRDALENTLNVLGYTINPFTEEDQINFLLKFWQLEGPIENENLKEFAKQCVNTLSSKMTNFERNIAGIPFQCKLLTEIYTNKAKRWSKPGASKLNLQSLSHINSIFELYEKHIKTRLQNWESQIEAVKNVHMYYALELLFQEHAHQFLALKTCTFSPNELSTFGFIEAKTLKNVRFVHRTFAEYFVAWFAVEMKRKRTCLSF